MSSELALSAAVSALSVMLFAVCVALVYVVYVTRVNGQAGRVEVEIVRVPDFMERQIIKLMIEAGYDGISSRAVNGNRLIDLTGYRVR